MRKIYGIFLFVGVMLIGSARGEENSNLIFGYQKLELMTIRNVTADQTPAVLTEPLGGAVSENGTGIKDKAAPTVESVPNAEVNFKPEAAGKLDETKETMNEVTIADPIEPVNRVIFQFNDKFYFWVLKPAALGYNAVVTESVRISVRNFFRNVKMPIRFVNSIFQGKFKGAGTELARFGINTTLGVAGFFEVAESRFDLVPYNKDFGQTLGVYGMGGVMYIVLPFLGPSTLRDSVGLAGDTFLSPVSYISPIEAALGVTVYEQLNKTSLELGTYENLKSISLEPYIGVRDAYIQHRNKIVNE